jgi:hypothetical protein
MRKQTLDNKMLGMRPPMREMEGIISQKIQIWYK